MDGGEIGVTHSLQRQLSKGIGSVVLVAGLLAAAASFAFAYFEAKELQDDMLRQIAVLSASHITKGTSLVAQNIESNIGGISDPDSRVSVFHLPSPAAPTWLKPEWTPGLHSVDGETEQMRIFVLSRQSEETTVVAQPTEARNEIAINSGLRTLIPLLLLLPILVWVINRIVRRELAPITALANKLDEQVIERPQAISGEKLPDEITPFVQAINRLLSRVNQLLLQQRRFVADAAHELRSPLAAISIQAENLASATSLEMMHERLRSLQAGIQRTRQLAEQLLNLAKTQTSEPVSAEVNVSVMARELIAEYLLRAEAKEIDLGLDEKENIVLQGSADALRLILSNALDNAIKYTPRGGEVTLHLYTNASSAIIEIVDNGMGIPPEEFNHVFDPFCRLQNASGEGSGLGLSIAKEAANRLGGIISLHERLVAGGLIVRYRQHLG